MTPLIAVLFSAILLNGDVYSVSANESMNSSEEVASSNISDSGDHGTFRQLRNRFPTVVGNVLEESNRTGLQVTTNGTVDEPTSTDLANQTSFFSNMTRQNESTTPTESTDLDHDLTVGPRFDESGCDTHLRDKHEDACYENFEHVLTESMKIEDAEEQGKQVCCASEGYERCCVYGYEQANCKADHNAIKGKLKAARMFMATLSDISCAKHRGKCGFNSASTWSPLSSLFLVTLGLLPIVILL